MKYIFIATMVILFLIISFLFYNNVFLKNYIKNSDFKDVANIEKRQEEINLYFVSADWCPYCKKAEDPWRDFVSKYNNTLVNNRRVNCIKKKDSDTDFNKTYNIEKYPTVFIIYNKQRFDFDSSVTFESLKEFVNFVAYK
jgi:thiol-disulfide isomerase/thioredoxin